MRKNATKIAAMMLSLALTVTSVNVPTTSSAATKVKLNKTKATLYVGGASSKKTTTLKATYKGKKVKATFTSSNSKVAKVAKSTGKVTAVKKGTATITAKYSGKKATCKVTVKQYVTKITAPATIELKEGEIVDLSKQVTVSPASANNKDLSYVPDESYIAGVNKDGTILKGVKEGKTVVTIKAKDGSGKKANVVVNVKAADAPSTDEPGTETPAPGDNKEAKEIKVGIENPFSSEEQYANTLLVGTNAYVTVQLTDEDGKPVANQEVELTSKKIYPTGAADKYIEMFGNVSESVKKTDSKGNVTFVYGLDKSTDPVQGKVIDATRTEFVSSFKLTAAVVGNKEITKSVDVKFASLSNAAASSGVYVRNGVANTPYAALPLVKGVNAANATATTKGRNEENITYVSSQQVSAKDSDAHRVAFDSGVGSLNLTMPGSETTGSEAERVKETINWSTDKYLTYAGEQKNTSGGWVLKGVQASDLQYATVTFDKLRLSKYSQFLVRAYIVTNKDNPTAGAPNVITPITLKPEESNIGGPKAEDNFSVQIPVSANAGYLYVTAQIVSKGQVNTDLNEGFTVRSIEGVKKPGSSTVTSIGSQQIQGLEVTWAKDDNVTYTINQPLSNTHPIYTALTSAPYNYSTVNNTFWYKTPAFPATGNAIITVRDTAGKDIAYFAAPTQNEPYVTAAGNTAYRNVNVLLNSATDLYQISQEEATRLAVGEVKQDGNDAIVNSYESGVTHLVGTIKSTNANIKIDESNSRIYTSVHWNPVQNTSTTGPTATGIAAAALVGQNLVLRAQLTDKNGNVVSTNGVPVEFYKNKAAAAGDKILATDNTVGEASLVKIDAATNALGQAELVLNSGKPAQALDIVAKAGNDKFDITYKVGTQTVSGGWVDLYWVDANLYFEPGYQGGSTVSTSLDTPVKETKATTPIEPTVGQNWAYEVRTSGEIRDGGNGGTLAPYVAVDIKGLTIQTSVGTGSVGSVTDANNGKAQATSTKAGYADIVNELNNTSIGKDVTLTFKKANGESKEVPYAGEGTATLSKKLTLNVNWGHSVPTANFVIPTGRQADVLGGAIKTYVEVKDANGNPIKDRVITLKVTGVGGATGLSLTPGIDANGLPTAKTNEEGIASFTLDPTAGAPAAAGQTSTLVATVDGMTTIAQSSVKWITPVAGFKATRADYDYNTKTIKLTFNNAVSAESVIKENFTVMYDTKEQIVSEIKVSGKEVFITIPALVNLNATDNLTVTVASATQAKTDIEYNLVSTDAQKLTTTTWTFPAKGADL